MEELVVTTTIWPDGQRIADARQNVYALVEQVHERNPDVPPDVIDALVEEAREATRGQQ
jgi:hypothetical protein